MPINDMNAEAAARPAGYLILIRSNRNVRNLWYGQIISLLGDWFNLIASAALIARITGSGLAIGGLFVLRMLAPFLISPFAGVIADRYNRKHTLILADISRAGIVLGFLFVRGASDAWLLYLLTFLQLAIGGIFFPTRNAILPDIVDQNELGTANALASTTWSVMLALGAALGGLVAGSWGVYPAFSIDAISFLLSALFISQIRYRWTSPELTGGLGIRNVSTEYFAALRYLREHADIFNLTLQKALWSLVASGAFQVLQVELSKQVFVLGSDGGVGLGILYTTAGLGTGLGPIITRRFTGDREGPLRIALAVAYGLTTLGLLVTATLGSFAIVNLGNFIRAFGGGINWVFTTQLLLMLVPMQMRGRVFSTEFAFFTFASAISAGVGGWALDQPSISYQDVLLWLSLISLIPGILWMISIIMRRRQPPTRPDYNQPLPAADVVETPVTSLSIDRPASE